LKILLIHTFYRENGGEDAVFSQEEDLLSQTEDVRHFALCNRQRLRGALQFFLSVWNVFAARKLRREIEDFEPDIIHIHNMHFAIGPIAKNRNIPVVVTLHNYRLLCPSATLLHDDKIFTNSVTKSFPWLAVRNRVYRHSFLQTFWLAFVVWAHKKMGTWNKVDKYIALTSFAKELFVHSSFGIQEDKFVVKPNSINQPFLRAVSRRDHFLFVGRLSSEKGIGVLLKVFKENEYRLYIAGDGKMKEEVLRECDQNENIEYLGNLDKLAVRQAMSDCSALIFPSIWYEGGPMTLLEAFSLGTPIIASNLGAMSTMIQHGYNGLHFKKGNTADLADKLDYWQTLEEEQRKTYSENAYSTFLTHYTPQKNKEELLRIYKTLLNR
jgi:glycosyltransferase involved in cell wall biosynthesis